MKNFNIQSLGLVMMLIAMISTKSVPNDKKPVNIDVHLKYIHDFARKTMHNASDKWETRALGSNVLPTCVNDTNHKTALFCLAQKSLNDTTTKFFDSTKDLMDHLEAYNNLTNISCELGRTNRMRKLKLVLKEIIDCADYELQ